MNEESLRLFDHIRKPVVLLRAGKVLYLNKDAQAILHGTCAGMPASQCLPAEVIEAQGAHFELHARWVARDLIFYVHQVGDVKEVILEEERVGDINISPSMLSFLKSCMMNLLLGLEAFGTEVPNDESPAAMAYRSMHRTYYRLFRALRNVEICSQRQEELVLNPVIAPLGEHVKTLVDSVSVLCPQMYFSVTLRSETDIQYDPELIEILLLNIFSNAMLHGKSASYISVSVVDVGNQVMITVHDDGSGFSPDATATLFEHWKNEMGMDDFSSVGIGLTAAARIAQAHQGTILAESNPKTGTRIVVTLNKRLSSAMHAKSNRYERSLSTLLMGLSEVLGQEYYAEPFIE